MLFLLRLHSFCQFGLFKRPINSEEKQWTLKLKNCVNGTFCFGFDAVGKINIVSRIFI